MRLSGDLKSELTESTIVLKSNYGIGTIGTGKNAYLKDLQALSLGYPLLSVLVGPTQSREKPKLS